MPVSFPFSIRKSFLYKFEKTQNIQVDYSHLPSARAARLWAENLIGPVSLSTTRTILNSCNYIMLGKKRRLAYDITFTVLNYIYGIYITIHIPVYFTLGNQ